MLLIYTNEEAIRRDGRESGKSGTGSHDRDREGTWTDSDISKTITADELRSLPIFVKSKQLASREMLIRQKIRRMTEALEERIRDLSRTEPRLCDSEDDSSNVGHRDTAA